VSIRLRTFLTIVCLTSAISAQNLWLWNQRTHPELHWKTIQTDHFNIHYHQGLESIARKGAVIAEQVYPVILEQLQVKPWGRTDMVFTAEDEIMNGFAMPSDQIFIWVSQNDVAGWFGGSEKWLKLVIAHEFQHVAQMHAMETWAGIWNLLSVPGWWLEGMAEYETEVWRVGRSDNRLKVHTYKNILEKLDAHDQGFAKVLYLAWKYGDSTLVKISRHRIYLDKKHKRFPIWFSFKKAFKEATGQTVAEFEEEWRRVMNSYYWAYKAAKEGVDETGRSLKLPKFHKISTVSLAPDSSAWAIIGQKTNKQFVPGLYVVKTDSTKKEIYRYFGYFTGQPAWSPGGRYLVVSEYHRGRHGSLIFDLRLIDLKEKRRLWLTHDMRALHPTFDRQGLKLLFVAHPQGETTQLYELDLKTNHVRQLTHFQGDIQLQRPQVSPDGRTIVLVMQDTTGAVDLVLLDRQGKFLRKLTDDKAEDLQPVWVDHGKQVVFTSFRNGTPNLYRLAVAADSSDTLIQMTDVAEGIVSLEKIPRHPEVLTTTLPDVDTARFMAVNFQRQVKPFPLSIRSRYLAWRTKRPVPALSPIKYDTTIQMSEPKAYQSWRTFRTLLWLAYPNDLGLLGLYAMNDALGKDLIQVAGEIGYNGRLLGGVLSYTNLHFLPALSFWMTKNFSLQLRNLPRGLMAEVSNGGGVSFTIPFNDGNALYRNHLIIGRLSRLYRYATLTDGQKLPAFNETRLSLAYQVKSFRAHKYWVSLPENGWGFRAQMNFIPAAWHNSYAYQDIAAEGFLNWHIPKTPFVLYHRWKVQRQAGTIPAQDSIGFYTRNPLYLSPGTLFGSGLMGLFESVESYQLRGQTEDYPATELGYSTLELRMALLPSFPAELLGISLRHFTGALFMDTGWLPDHTPLFTYGAEIKANLSLNKAPLVVLSWGVAGARQRWSDLSQNENLSWKDLSYFRLALVNPF